MIIIDAHAHMEDFKELGLEDTPEKVISYMDMAGISAACISTYTNLPGQNEESMEYYHDCCKRYPGKFIPFLRVNPGYGDKAVQGVEKAVKKYDFRGVKLHPIDYSLTPVDEGTIMILNQAAELDIPVLFHCSDEIMCLPLEIEMAAKQCPDTKIILGHMGGLFHQDDAIKIAGRNKNVYLETCEQPYVQGIKRAVKELGSEKILFGTDIPTDNPILEVKKIKMADLGLKAEENIFFHNICKLVKIRSLADV